MVKIMDARNSSKEPGGFWEAYRAYTEENRVRPDRSPFYVNWAKDFANFLPEKPLTDRSRKDIEAFLVHLGKRRGIADWQVRQAEHALRILYEIFLPRYAPEKHTAVAPAGKHPAQEAISKAGGFRDRSIRGTSYVAPVKRENEKILSFVKTASYETVPISGTLLPQNSFVNSRLTRRISRQ